eukprot:TRINITY_DN3551_c1_g1_i2.p1 TRINITY_DN3551_c1_g1~~TRINITY_DN3551_c1_g1_i2.p1  ORF type:complete len:964 (+),score=391.17 TRINITY_DN3551_c1_g1_i2:74-2965(+)
MPKRPRAPAPDAESSSSMDSEARRRQVAKRARRRAEHEMRKQQAKEQRAAEKEALRLALMSPEERRAYEREKERQQIEGEVRQRKVKVERLQRMKAKVRGAEEKELERAREEHERRNEKWTLDSDEEKRPRGRYDEELELPDAAPADEVDPLDAFMTGVSAELAELPRIIGVNDRARTTIAPDELRTMQWKELQERAAAPDREAESGEDEEAAQKFIAALKGVDASAEPQADDRAREEEERRRKQDEAILAELEEKSKAKDFAQMDFDDKEFVERSYRVEAPEVKIKDLKPVDHSKIDYHPFRKDFYVPCAAVKALTPEQVKKRRQELDKIKIKGEDLPGNPIPAPVERWAQSGLDDTTLRILKEAKFELPFPIQAQGLPVIMSGRDTIGCARTGTGKTLAYVLPMLRHILDQPGLADGDGPIAFVLVPTHELAQQVLKETDRFAPRLGLRFMASYGGVPIADQIAEARRGVHGIIATPGRLIDLMVANKGKVVPTNRATFVVLDEADRMLDFGLGPQMVKIVANIRPDRQTVMFSATVPKMIEVAAKKLMTQPVQVIIGGRRNPSSNVEQHVECFESDEHRWLRLLQLLGEWYSKGLILIFAEKQTEVDQLWEDLYAHGYDRHCISLHSGMDQIDRDLALHDFKTGEGGKRILVATSVASRGIDVPDIELVVNYKCPSHVEEYIHRVGRTGRANKKGVAWTFYMIGTDECHATWLVRALQDSNNTVPEQLQQIANEFWQKRRNGLVPYFRPNQGYTGRGYKFDYKEARRKRAERKAQMRAHGLVDESDDEKRAGSSDEDYVRVDVGPRAANVTAEGSGRLVLHQSANIDKAKAYADQLSMIVRQKEEMAAQQKFNAEVEINDYPQSARWKVTNREMCASIIERFEATVMVKGMYCKGAPPPGERKLYLQIDGKDELQVQGAKRAIIDLLEEETQKAMAAGSALGVGRPIRPDGRPGKFGAGC